MRTARHRMAAALAMVLAAALVFQGGHADEPPSVAAGDIPWQTLASQPGWVGQAVEHQLAPELMAIGSVGGDAGTWPTAVLSLDGRDRQIAVILSHGLYCGAAGCRTVILAPVPDNPPSSYLIFDATARHLSIGPVDERGLATVLTDDETSWVFRDGRYRVAP